jgi:hypothetical protein
MLIFKLLFIVGCADNSNCDNNSTTEITKKESIEKVKKNENETKNEPFLNKMGIEIENKKIIIDLNKSGHFFSEMGKKVKSKAEELKKEIETETSSILADINKSIN